ncbi:MAG: glycosyltransferase [Acidobacteria bacterium]|nr:glycosyltransferase [Acidobacteriota bacterium]
MKKETCKTLYLCYFGLREPLVQTQVLPYLREIKKGGVGVSILTFERDPGERWTPEQIAAEREKLAAEGIEWDFLTYHKRPSAPATLYDVLCGAFYAWRKTRRDGIDVLHARVHTPAMMGALAKLFLRRKPKLLFDIRGFFPEEYTDAGIWKPDGGLYRAVKRIEKWLLGASDGFVVLTEKARSILFPESAETGFDRMGRPVEVIPCCVNLRRFETANAENRARMRRELGVEDRFVAVYVGSFGGWYLTAETADFYGALKERRKNAFALVLTQSPPEMIAPLLAERGYSEQDYLIKQVRPAEIPLYLSAADAAVSFIKACYSKQASSPTKNAEYLACGLPVVVNDGVGDTTLLTEADETGVVLENFGPEDYRGALEKLDALIADRGQTAARCRASARRRFDLEEVGGTRYRRLYERLLGKN